MAFDRWIPIHNASFPFRVFKQYNAELNRLNMAYQAAFRYSFSQLGINGAKPEDKAIKFLYTHNDDKLTIKKWAQGFNDFDNYLRLNNLMAMLSYFETYIASIISLAIDSDPGIILSSPHSIDGAKLLKEGITSLTKDEKGAYLKGCTKGDWQARIVHMKRLFGTIPASFDAELSNLEKMRVLRNNVGHAFGRDIESARISSSANTTPMEILSKERFIKYQKIIRQLARQLNDHLQINHIGNYQYLYHYQSIYDDIYHIDRFVRMNRLKKSLGQSKNIPYSKEFCMWVVDYYESL